MSAEHFFDSNVLVYSVDRRSPEKRQYAKELVARSLTDGSGCISYQVVQETLNVLIGRLGAPHDRVRSLLDEVLVPLWQVYPTVALYQSGISLQSRYGFSY